MEEVDKVAGKVADEVARNPGWQNSTRVAEILQFKNRRVSCTCVVAPTNAFFCKLNIHSLVKQEELP